jgi:hypothetical protein
MGKIEIRIFAIDWILKHKTYRQIQSQMLLPTKNAEEQTARDIKGISILKHLINQ